MTVNSISTEPQYVCNMYSDMADSKQETLKLFPIKNHKILVIFICSFSIKVPCGLLITNLNSGVNWKN